jgi:hypothetical protein
VGLLSTTLGDERVLLSIICDKPDSQGRGRNPPPQSELALNAIRAVAREPLDLKQLVNRTLDEVLRLGVFEVKSKYGF